MSFDKLKEFIELAKKSGATELEYKSDKETYSVSFQAGISYSTHSQPVMQNHVQTTAIEPAQSKLPAKKHEENLTVVPSPFVGTFYRSASPDSPPYAKIGDKIKKGDVLCIVEAMKIMNEIESEVSGEIIEICVENENYVEFNQALFKIRPN